MLNFPMLKTLSKPLVYIDDLRHLSTSVLFLSLAIVRGIQYKLQYTRVKPYKECTQNAYGGSSEEWPGGNVLATILKLSSFGALHFVFIGYHYLLLLLY